MKKLSLIFCLTMLFLISNCTEQSNNSITNSQEHQIENKENSAIDPYVSSVLNAAERDIPISPDDGYTIGVLDENRTENHCYVLYYNSKELQKYRFIKDAYWNIDSCVFAEEYSALSKTSIYESTIAIIYYQNQNGDWIVKENNWFINDKTTTGDYTLTRSYYSPLPDRTKFIEGSESNNNKNWVVNFEGWHYAFANSPNTWYDYGNTYKDYLYPTIYDDDDDKDYKPVKVRAYYHLTVTDNTPPPSAPTLISPSNGATTATSVNFSWNAVTGQDVTKYEISVLNSSGSEVRSDDNVTGTSKTFTGFSYSNTFTWKVKAYNGEWGNPSSERSFTVQSAPPLSVSVVGIGNDQYSASASGGSGTYSSYDWWYRNDGLMRAPQVGVWIKNSSWDDQTTVTFDPGYNFSLKCEVTDSDGNTDDDTHSVVVGP